MDDIAIAPDAIAHLAFTSGTTGQAKAVPLTHANVLASAMDRWPPDEAIGTLAGDDTIFVATSGRTAASRLTGKLLARAGLRRRSRSA